MLGDNKPNMQTAGNPADIFDTGLTLMQNGAYADAFLLFSKFESDENQIAVNIIWRCVILLPAKRSKRLSVPKKCFPL
jgi:hypothetical protein